eukprot:scaffold14163_cov115-Isochrysis_galbana.AAC.1
MAPPPIARPYPWPSVHEVPAPALLHSRAAGCHTCMLPAVVRSREVQVIAHACSSGYFLLLSCLGRALQILIFAPGAASWHLRFVLSCAPLCARLSLTRPRSNASLQHGRARADLHRRHAAQHGRSHQAGQGGKDMALESGCLKLIGQPRAENGVLAPEPLHPKRVEGTGHGRVESREDEIGPPLAL